jgi:hypothetical protein
VTYRIWQAFLLLAFGTGVVLLILPARQQETGGVSNTTPLAELLETKEKRRAMARDLERGAQEAFTRFLNASGWEERRKWMADPDTAGPLLEAYGKDHPDDLQTPVKFLRAEHYLFFEDPGRQEDALQSLCLVDLADLDKRVPALGAREGRLYVPVMTAPGGPKVDAVYFYSFAGRLFDWFCQSPRTMPLVCHGRITKASLLDERASGTDWACYLVEASSVADMKFRAMLRADSPVNVALKDVAQWDQAVFVRMELRWTEWQGRPELTITRLVAPGWGFLPRELTEEEFRAHTEAVGL